LPREHGAYAQLLVPLVIALAATGGSTAAALLAIGACLAFLANEPLLVTLGHRGRRALADHGARAAHRLRWLITAAVAIGGAGFLLAPEAARVLVLFVLVPAVAVGVLAWKKLERTALGEMVAAIALTGASAPVAAAAGMSIGSALLGWAVWALGFVLVVVAVRLVIAHLRPRAWHLRAIGISVVVASLAIAAIVISTT
jgi:hypothetical protein